MSSIGIMKRKKKFQTKSKRADVIFPVARLHRFLKTDTKKFRVGVGAAVYAASVLEYLVAEVMELAGNNAKENKRARITPRHIFLATALDQELHELMKGVTMPYSGVIPRINSALFALQTKNKPVAVNQQNTILPLTTKASPPVPKPTPVIVNTNFNYNPANVPLKLRVKGIKVISKGINAKNSHFNVLSEKKLFLGQKLLVVQSDITKIITEAIVHPTNSGLALFGHVGQAIEKEGGQKLRAEIAKVKKSGNLNSCDVILTPAINLSSQWIIHVNGPSHRDVNAYDKLETSVKNCLALADSKNLKSIALPSIGSGKSGFPKQQAAQTILKAISNYFSSTMASSIKLIYFVLYDMESIGIYTSELARLDG